MRPQEATQLTVASATALRRAIESQTGLKAEIKWPNDILIHGRKVAGILTELSAELDHVKYVILGIGVDVNLSAGDFPPELRKLATSLKAELGKAGLAARTRRGHSARVGPRLRAHRLRPVRGSRGRVGGALAPRSASEVVIRTGERQIRGRAESLGEDGALLLRTEHGHLERIVGGDVTLEK